MSSSVLTAPSPVAQTDRQHHRLARSRRILRRVRRPELTVIALLAFIGYLAAGWWLKYTYNFALGDALARTLDARLMIAGRDPHAAAIGLYWMPLPTASQVPFMAVLGPLGYPAFAGPASTAFWTALTLPVLGRIAIDLRLPRLTGAILTLGYALNPIVVYYAINGMGEACEFFWVAVTLWGLLRFLRRDDSGSATICAIGLAGLALSKYEAAPAVGVVFFIVAVVHVRRYGWRERLTDLFLVGAPALWLVILWLFYMKIIAGSFFAFRQVARATQGGPLALGTSSSESGFRLAANTGTDPLQIITNVAAASGSISKSIIFVGIFILAFFPAIAIVGPTLLLPPYRRTLQGLAVLAVGGGLILTTSYLVYTGGTFGNARYFTPVILPGFVGLLLVGARVPLRGLARLPTDLALLLLVVLTAFTGTVLEQQETSGPEQEYRVFRLLLGEYRDQPYLDRPSTDFSPYFRSVTSTLDGLIKPGDRVLVDTRFTGPVALFTDHPGQLIVNADRDYEAIVSPSGLDVRLDYAVVPSPQNVMGLPAGNDDAYRLVHREPGWSLLSDGPAAQIWARDPSFNRDTVRAPQG